MICCTDLGEPDILVSERRSNASDGAQEVVVIQDTDDEVQVIAHPQSSIEVNVPKKCRSSDIEINDVRSPRPPKPSHKLLTISSPVKHSSKQMITCPVCMDTVHQFEKSGRHIVTTVCGHIFCNVCIRSAISTQHKCPTCRKKLNLKQYHSIFL